MGHIGPLAVYSAFLFFCFSTKLCHKLRHRKNLIHSVSIRAYRIELRVTRSMPTRSQKITAQTEKRFTVGTFGHCLTDGKFPVRPALEEVSLVALRRTFNRVCRRSF